ncbi:hypothetical protein GUJ93_ZPchr0002g23603 [Zizania palustris]|uniref:Uncharacterized protein n=1 Tax=Zizania palustris TaxID=103762 RepID=A0A8J5S9F1_ZIZPA|nr:hypothetical protein GUJ93_ZPchr0002g23603 [Zizania palustris]
MVTNLSSWATMRFCRSVVEARISLSICLASSMEKVSDMVTGWGMSTGAEKSVSDTKLFGFAYGGPFGHFLHKVLDYIFKGKKDTKTVAKKVLLEQITSSPWNNMLFLFYYGYVVERRPFKEVKTRVKKQYPSVQLSAWMGGISQPSCKGHVFEAGIDSSVGKTIAQLNFILTKEQGL